MPTNSVRDDNILAVRFIHKLRRGASQPVLIEASDGIKYVLKFNNNPQGPNVPFNEAAGSELYSAFGLAVPTWNPILVTEAFIERNPGCWMDIHKEKMRPSAGLCFGSRFLGEDGFRVTELFSGNRYERIRSRGSFWAAWLLDVCADQTDVRQAVFIEDSQRMITVFFIDHGNLFGGPNGDKQGNFLSGCRVDWEIYPDIWSGKALEIQAALHLMNTDSVCRQIESFPSEWKRDSALDRFSQCLERLSNVDFLEKTADRIIRAYKERVERALRGPGTTEPFPNALLRGGI
jgi:hypothetical protein